MAFHGLMRDSPLLHYAQKGARYATKHGGGSGLTKIGTSFTFQGLVIYKPILNFELKHPQGMVGAHLHKIGMRIQHGARAQVGVKSGRLKRSIHMTHRRDPMGQAISVGSNVNYAYMHHEGTKPHLIVPKKAEVLSFGRGARIVHTKVVRHPGTKPNRYLSDQLRLHVR